VYLTSPWARRRAPVLFRTCVRLPLMLLIFEHRNGLKIALLGNCRARRGLMNTASHSPRPMVAQTSIVQSGNRSRCNEHAVFQVNQHGRHTSLHTCSRTALCKGNPPAQRKTGTAEKRIKSRYREEAAKRACWHYWHCCSRSNGGSQPTARRCSDSQKQAV